MKAIKKYILLFVILISGSIVIAGNINNKEKESKENSQLVFGKVVDKKSGEEIVGAEVIIAGKIVYTDLNGIFSVGIPASQTEVVIKSISYNDLKISIDPFSYNTVVVELESK